MLADLVGLGCVDGPIIGHGPADFGEQFAEVRDEVLGGMEQIGVNIAAFGLGVVDEEPAGFVAEPAHDRDVAGDADDVAESVERVSGPAGVGVIAVGVFAPLVNQRGTEPQFGGQGLHSDLVGGASQYLMRSHDRLRKTGLPLQPNHGIQAGRGYYNRRRGLERGIPTAMSNVSFQTKSDIRRLLQAHGLSPRKRFGQNFLIDGNLMRKLVEASEIGPDDCVIEIGAGTGSLTGLLAARAGQVVAAEIDPKLFEIASEHNRRAGNLTLLRLDALHNKSTLEPVFVDAIKSAASRVSGGLMLVANLPYDVATPLVIDILLTDLPLRRLCFAVQSEVANRFMARPSTGDYGPATIITQAMADMRRICQAPPQAFWPAPKVSTTMLRLDVREPGRFAPAEVLGFARLVRAFFLHRRKTMSHNAKRLPDGESLLTGIASIGVDPRSRPEELTVDQWIRLFGGLERTETGE